MPKPSPVNRPTGRRLLAFGWYGGKYSHLNWLLPKLPASQHYCEPYGGSAAVLLNRPPSPVETYNDIDGEVVNFFRVLRSQREQLIEQVALTPFSREEFAAACTLDSSLPDLERARQFYLRARQVRTGLAQTATLGRWANCKTASRRGMSCVVSRWLGGLEGLDEIAERLLRVQIENRPALEVIRLYDSPETLHYCDPPYLHETRGDSSAYSFEMDEAAHRALAGTLQAVCGRVVLSGYRCALMDFLYPAPRWRVLDDAEHTNHSSKGRRIESLWMNFDE